jgi:hypothetical protein
MATENCSDTSESEVGRRRHRFLSCVDWECDLAGIGPGTAVRWVLNRDTKAIVWLNLRERENGPWVMGTRSEEEDLEQMLLREHPASSATMNCRVSPRDPSFLRGYTRCIFAATTAVGSS